VRSAAKLFVSICESQAPFVAVENPKMHSLATDLVGGRKPTQYVQPYEHGTGHQKATGLYLTYNLPLILPTCIMAERTSAMADLPRSPHRGALRSRTYIGIAAAMALQWMPTLLGYCKIRTSRPKTVHEMLHAARLSLAATPSPVGECLVGRHASGRAVKRCACVGVRHVGSVGLSVFRHHRPGGRLSFT